MIFLKETFMEKNKLVALLEMARDFYYAGHPIISDESYDHYEDMLKKMDPKNPFFSKVGTTKSSTFEKVEHIYPMLSLDKVTSFEQLKSWPAYNEDNEFVISAKVDGFGVAIRYEHVDKNLYVFKQALSRGGGLFGDDITENVKQIQNIPKIIKTISSADFIEVRGEICCKKSVFNTLKEKGLIEPNMNIRNIAAGTCRHKDVSITKNRMLSFLAYDIFFYKNNGEIFKKDKYIEWLMWLHDLFETPEFELHLRKNLNYIEKIGLEWKNNLDYDIDGIVIRVNDCSIYERLGATSHHPRGAVAYKFQSATAITKMKDIIWQVSRTRRINPVAVFEPVEIGGVVIEKASLFNISVIEAMNLKMDSMVTIARSNDVIPYLKDPVGGTIPVKIPKVCPCCGQSTIIMNDGTADYLVCSNKKCPDAVCAQLEHFCEAMEIMGVSGETIKTLYNAKLITMATDLYRLKEHIEELTSIEGYGPKKIKNILTSIEKSKNTTLAKIIYSFGIDGIGKEIAKIIANKMIEEERIDLGNFTVFRIGNGVEGVGEKRVKAYNQFMDENSDMILELIQHLELTTINRQFNEESPIFNKSFCITGTLSISRDAMIKKIEENGGVYKSGVSRELDYLIVGENSGSKKTKALSLGVKIISEKEFMDMIGESMKNKPIKGQQQFNLF